MTSGEKLKTIRTQKSISRAELARMTKIPLRTIEDWEYGQNPLNNVNSIKTLAAVLGVDFKDLI